MNEDELEVGQEQVIEAEDTGSDKITNPAEETAQQPVSEESNVVEKGQPKKAYSKEEQAAYSFRKQLNKQKSRYEDQYGQLKTQYDELLARLDKLEHPEKYQPLNRTQFETDDSYIDALVQQRFEYMWNSKLEEAQKAYSEQTKQEQEISLYRNRADENVKKLYKTPEAEKQYRETISLALKNGLGELVDSDKETAMYIMRSDLGPKIMYELATKPEVVEEMFNDNVTDTDRQFKIRELESRLRQEQNKPALPVVGKPGIGAEAKGGSIFDSDDSILNYLRTH